MSRLVGAPLPARRDYSALVLFSAFIRAYPGRTSAILALHFAAGVAEGFGISAILPLVGVIISGAGGSSNELSDLINGVLDSFGLTPEIGSLLAFMVLLVSINAGLSFLAKWMTGRSMAEVSADYRRRLGSALMNARWIYFTELPLGRLAAAMGAEATRAGGAYGTFLSLCTSLLQAGLYATLAVTISWQAMLFGVAVGALMFVLLNTLVRRTGDAGKSETRTMQNLSVHLIDNIASIKPLKAMARERAVELLLSVETGRLRDAQTRQALLGNGLSALQEVMVVAMLAATAYVVTTQFNVQFAELLFIGLVFQRMVTRLGEVQKSLQKLRSQENALFAIAGTIASAEHAHDTRWGRIIPTLDKAIKFRDVHFAYGPRVVLPNLTLDVPARKLTVIIGPSGAGKSTIVDLVAGLHRASGGIITIDDIAFDEVDIIAWRERIGYVPQEIQLHNDTILANVTLNDAALSRSDAEGALRAAGAWDFVAALPGGLDTPVGERGTKLSGGQRQRISIARALVRRPLLLILDEATANLDPQTEAELALTVRDLARELTVLAITHRPSLLDVADVVYRIADGQLVTTSSQSGLQPTHLGMAGQ